MYTADLTSAYCVNFVWLFIMCKENNANVYIH